MGLMMRRRRPLARMAVGAATAGVAYHAGKKRSEQDQYNQQASDAYEQTSSRRPHPSMCHPRRRQAVEVTSTSSASSPSCTTRER